MKKYIVIDVFERDMGLPQIFDTPEAALADMVDVVATVLNTEPNLILQALDEGESFIGDGLCEVTMTSAWANVKQGRLDVAIFELDTETWRCAV